MIEEYKKPEQEEEENDQFTETHKKKMYQRPMAYEEVEEEEEIEETQYLLNASSTSLNLEGYLENQQKKRDELLYNERFYKKI